MDRQHENNIPPPQIPFEEGGGGSIITLSFSFVILNTCISKNCCCFFFFFFSFLIFFFFFGFVFLLSLDMQEVLEIELSVMICKSSLGPLLCSSICKLTTIRAAA